MLAFKLTNASKRGPWGLLKYYRIGMGKASQPNANQPAMGRTLE